MEVRPASPDGSVAFLLPAAHARKVRVDVHVTACMYVHSNRTEVQVTSVGCNFRYCYDSMFGLWKRLPHLSLCRAEFTLIHT